MARWFLAIFLIGLLLVAFPLYTQAEVDLTPLKAQLQDPDPARRIVAIQEIACSYDPDVSELLLPVLRDPDARIRAATARWAEEFISSDVRLALVELLQDPDATVRGAAACSYGSRHFDQAIEPLQKMLTDPAPEARAGAISGLGKIWSLKCLDPLIKGMKDPAPQVRAAAARALENIYQLQNWTTMPEDWSYQFMRETPDKATIALKKKYRWDEILSGIMALQKDPDVMVRASASIALTKFDKQIIAERFIEFFALTDTKIRHDLLGACNLIDFVKNDPHILNILYAAFAKEQDADIRCILANWLANFPDKRTIPTLKAALNEQKPRVLAAIIEALFSIRDPSVAIDLLPFTHHADPRVRGSAIKGIGLLQYTAAEDICLQALQDPDSEVCGDAIVTLGNMKSHKAVTPLLAILKSGDEQFIFETLGALINIDDPQVLEGLLAFETSDANLLGILNPYFSHIKDPRAEEKVFAALKDSDPQIQATALSALLQMSSTEAVTRIVAIMLQDKDTERRQWAARALCRKSDPRLVMSFIAALKDADIEVRRTALDGLEQLHDPRMIKPLLAMALVKNGSDGNLRRHAVATVLSFDTIPAGCNATFLVLLKDADPDMRSLSAEGIKRFKIATK